MYDRIESAVAAVVRIPVLAHAVAYELSLLAGPFIGWRRGAPQPGAFSHHTRGSYSTLMAGLCVVMVMEAVPLHFVLVRSHPVLAWILTAASAYALLWLAGDWRALSVRRTVVLRDRVELAVGTRWRAQVPFAKVIRVSVPSKADLARERGRVRAVLTRGEAPTVAMETREPVEVRGPYGVTRVTTLVLFAPDEPERFIAACMSGLGYQPGEK